MLASPAAPGSRHGFGNLLAYEVVSGRQPVQLRVPRGTTRVELSASGSVVTSATAPFSLTWDTTRIPDGLVTVSLGVQVGGRTTSLAPLPVVVLNHGSEVFFENGSSGEVVMPLTGPPPLHLRHHFRMPAKVQRVIALLRWSRPEAGLDLELAVGSGTCPHHGVTVARRHKTSSPLVLEHAAADGRDLDVGRWFAHVRLLNARKVPGQRTPFSVRAFLLRRPPGDLP